MFLSGRDPRALAVATAAAVLLASLVPVPDLAVGGAPGGGRGVDLLPAWVSLTTPFHLVGYAVLDALATRAAHAKRATERPTATGTLVTERPTATAPLAAVSVTGILVAAVIGILVAAAVGFGVELAQSAVPWRSFAWSDAGVNAIGAVVGAGSYAIRSMPSTATG